MGFTFVILQCVKKIKIMFYDSADVFSIMFEVNPHLVWDFNLTYSQKLSQADK